MKKLIILIALIGLNSCKEGRIVAQWSYQKLFTEQKRYQNIFSTTLFLGITSIVTGSVLFGYGIATIFDSGQAHEFMRGGIFTGTLGIPLLAF